MTIPTGKPRGARMVLIPFALAIAFHLTASIASSTVWRIAPNAAGSKPTIQAAIDAAADGDTVLVDAGTYTGTGNRDLELRGKAIAVIGADGPERTKLDCRGVEGDPHRGFYIHEREGAGTLIQGFTITNGYVEGKLPASYGGAILCMFSSPTIRDCRIIGNRSNHFGGGMVCYLSASPTLERVQFIDNKAVNNGGGFGSKKDCHPKLIEVLFVRNHALRGGAFWCWSAGATIDRATFYGNSAEMAAAGLWTNQADVKISNSIIACATKGDAVACTDPPPSITLVNCDIFGNAGGDELPSCATASGIFSRDPLFCDPAKEKYALREDSPCAPGRHPKGIETAGWIGAMEGCRDR